MKRIKKRLLVLGLAALTVLASSVTGFAEDRQGASGWQVVFDGKKLESNFSTANMDDEIYNMQPGDSVELTITLKNEYDKGQADWYMKNQVLQTLEDSGNISGGAYDYLLTYTDADGQTTTLYSSEKFGGEGRYNGVGLKGATTTLDDYFYLDRMGKDDSGVVKLKVALDAETLVNDYQNTLARLQMDFATELVEAAAGGGDGSGDGSGGNGTTTPGSGRSPVKTGDQTKIMLYIVLTLAAGLVLLFMGIMRLRRDREEEIGMKGFRKFYTGLLVLSVMLLNMGQSAYAAQDEEYTYTVRLFAGNQGELQNAGITASRNGAGNPAGVTVTYDKDQATVKGLKYGDTVYVNYQDAASVTGERYYVRGVRRSGRDNSEATESTFQVASDRDYVIAYGIKGDMVSYTVNYVNAAGEEMLPSDTYYGNPGEQQYVSARYVDGYQPQSYNLVKTLVSNEAENVFDFIYTPVPEGTTPEPAPTPTPTPAATTPAAPATTTPAAPAAATPATATPAATTPAATTPEVPATPAETEPVGGDQTTLSDENTPAGTTDLDDEATPLGQQDLEKDRPGTVMSYLPVYIGIGIAAAGALAVMAVYLRRRRKMAAAATSTVAKVVDGTVDVKGKDR